jgi:hypothetical protein
MAIGMNGLVALGNGACGIAEVSPRSFTATVAGLGMLRSVAYLVESAHTNRGAPNRYVPRVLDTWTGAST